MEKLNKQIGEGFKLNDLASKELYSYLNGHPAVIHAGTETLKALSVEVPTLKVKRIHELATLPEYKTPGAAGMDVSSIESCRIQPGEIKLIHTGLSFGVPEGLYISIVPRSGLALKNGISILNGPGTLDQDFIGELGIILINHGKVAFDVNAGDRIAQIILCPMIQGIPIQEVSELLETSRDPKGFGTTGIK